MTSRSEAATRIEKDSMGSIEVPADRYWGALSSTSRSARTGCPSRSSGPSAS
jgi:fumarate hydratase class II